MAKIHLKYPTVSVGIDYISLSYPVSSVRATYNYCLYRLGIAGEVVTVQREQLYGYDGYRHNGRYVGIREDRERQGWWRMYELASSAGAAGHDLACRESDVTVNRLDVQATLLVHQGDTLEAIHRVNAVIRRVRDHVARYAQSATGHMRRLSHSWVESSSNGVTSATLYIGSRSSDVVTRIYNKTAEAGINDGSGLLRVEVELKDSYAERARQAIVVHGVSAGGILAGMLARYDIVVPGIGGGVAVTDKRLTRRSTDKTIRWLRSSVSKSVARLVHSEGVDKGYLHALLFGGLGD